MNFDDDDLLIMAGAAAVLGAAWWFMRQGGAVDIESAYGDDSGFTDLGIGEVVSSIQNAIWSPPAAAKPYLPAIAAAESKYGLPTNLLARLLHQESHYRADIISGKTKSSVGAMGIAQFMPATAKQYGINPLDPFQSIDAAGKMLKSLYARFGAWDKALASYNWGQGNVARKGLANAPTETKNYFSQILADIGLA